MSSFIDILTSPNYLIIVANKFIIFLNVASIFYITYRAGFINLGISAQLIIGALLLSFITYIINNLFIGIILTFIFISILNYIPFLLRYKHNVSEILVTLFILFIVLPLSRFILSNSSSSFSLVTPQIQDSIINNFISYFPRLHPLIMFSLSTSILLIIIYLLFVRSKYNIKMEVIRFNLDAISVKSIMSIMGFCTILTSLLILNFLTFHMIIGNNFRYISGEYDNLGFLAVTIGLLSTHKFSFFIFFSFLIAFFETIFILLKTTWGLPQMLNMVVYGILLIILAYKMVPRNVN